MKRFLFVIGLAFAAVADCFRPRRLATNTVMTPNEISDNGVASLHGTAAIATKNYVVVRGADDAHFKIGTLVTDVPLGVIYNDEITAAEVDVVKKGIALFGLYPGTIPAVSEAAIAVDALLTPGVGTFGTVKALPATAGTYWVIGRNRLTVAGAAAPVSIIHCAPYQVKVGINGVAAAVWVPQNADGAIGGLNSTAVNPTKADYDLLLAAAEKMSDDLRALKVILDASGITTT